jgi:hypothetical protein
MAGDWVKMRGSLLTNPKVIRMARHLSENEFFREWWVRGTRSSTKESVTELCDMHIVTRVTVASLLAVWSAANECIDGDDILRHAELYEIDEMAGAPGFGEAMALVGWAIEIEDVGVHLPNFKEHNKSGKERVPKSGKERTQDWRSRKKAAEQAALEKNPVTKCDAGDAREEKRREEKKKTPLPPSTVPLPPGLDTPAFREAWSAWLEDRKARKVPVTARAAAMQLAKLVEHGPGVAVLAIQNSIANQWKGLFPESVNRNGNGKAGRQSATDYARDTLLDAVGGPTR